MLVPSWHEAALTFKGAFEKNGRQGLAQVWLGDGNDGTAKQPDNSRGGKPWLPLIRRGKGKLPEPRKTLNDVGATASVGEV